MGGSEQATLYDRLGGDSFANLVTDNFFDELVENPDVEHFFKHISKSALKCHQVKLFRVIFGKEEDKPEEEDVLDFMLRTHTRLFRELGLDETHFDVVATCFVQGLQSLGVEQFMVDECLVILAKFRVVFEYGAKVAAKEKAMTEQEVTELPLASPKTFGTDALVRLPEYSKINIPDWLPQALGKRSNTSKVRAWTCDLTDRFGAEGDEAIADTFMDQPYMDHHVYLVAFLQMAFLPEDVEPGHREKILQIVMFPRGPKNAPLSKELFDRMIAQFKLTCHKFGMSNFDVRAAETALLAYRNMFAQSTTLVGGVNAPHILLKVHEKKQKKRRSTRKSANSAKGDMDESDRLSVGSLTLLDFDDDSDSCSTCSGMSGVSKNSSLYSISSTGTGTSGKKKSKKKKKKHKNRSGGKRSRWSIFKSLVGGGRKQEDPGIPTSIVA